MPSTAIIAAGGWLSTRNVIAPASPGSGVPVVPTLKNLIPGIRVTVEPRIYLPEFGVRCEIDLYLPEQGPVVTTDQQTDIVLTDV